MERRSRRRGNYSMLMGFSLVGILGMGAIGVDISYLATANDQAQTVADAASHAALLTYRDSEASSHETRAAQAMVAAQWVVDNNDVGFGGTADLSQLEFGVFDVRSGGFTPGGGDTPNGVRATVSRKGDNALDTILAGVIGTDQMEVERASTTAFSTKDVMLVVDLSGSMYDGRGVPHASQRGATEVVAGVRYATAHKAVRNALVAFGEYSVQRRAPGDRLGVSVFAENSVLWQPAQRLSSEGPALLAALEDWGVPNASRSGTTRSYPSGDRYAVVHQLGRRWYFGTRGNKKRGLAYASNSVDDCQDVMDAQFRWEGWDAYPDRPNVCDIGSCTNPGPAVDLAVDEMVSRGTDGSFKAIVVLSDGMPTCGDGANGLLSATARAWDDHGIHVWTVAYDGADGIDAGLMEEAARGLGTYSETPDPDQLDDLMVDIAERFPVAIVR